MEQSECDLLEQVDKVTTLGECLAWMQQCGELIEQLEERSRAKRARLSIGYRQSVVTQIARLEGAKIRLQKRFIHIGGDYASTSSDSNNVEKKLTWREIDTAFKNRVMTGAVINADYIEPLRFLKDASNVVLEQVQDAIKKYSCVKVNTVFNGEFVAGEKCATKSINTRNCELFQTSNLQEWYERRVIAPTLASLEEFQERDSGWALSRILNLIINVNKYNLMRAGCRMDMPREIKLKRAVINVESTDNACFAWSVVAALHPAERHVERKSSYPHYTTVLNLKDIDFPITLKQIKKFEQLNNISINVYCIEKEKKKLAILPMQLTDNKKNKHVNLLYVEDLQDNNVGHFAWIKNLSRLVGSQLSDNKRRKYICDQ